MSATRETGPGGRDQGSDRIPPRRPATSTHRTDTDHLRRNQEQTPCASAEWLRTVVARAPVVLFAVDRDGVFTLSEGQGLELLGIQPDEHVGRSYFGLYGHLPDSVAAMRGALSGKEATTINRYQGLVFETRWTPIRDSDRTISGAIGVSADVTARTRLEEERSALLEREREARAEAQAQAAEREAVFEALTDGVFVFDRDGTLRRMNGALRALLDLSPQDAKTYGALTPDQRGAWLAVRDAEGQPLPRDRWPVSRILHGEVLTGARMDVLVRTQDGREVLLGVSGAPLYDEMGQVCGGVCVCRDMTERQRLERRTRAALEALLAMAEAMVREPHDIDNRASAQAVAHRLGALTCDVLGCHNVGLIAVTEDDVLQPLDCVGLSTEQVERWRDRILRWPRDTDLFRMLSARLHAGETVLIDTTRPEHGAIANPFGVDRYLLVPMRIGATLVGVLSVDVSAVARGDAPSDATLVEAAAKLAALVLERERLQREREEARAHALALAEANRRMDEFLAIAGHEMCTPLTTIKGNLQLAQSRLQRLREPGDTEKVGLARGLAEAQHRLDRTNAQLDRLQRLVNDLLDTSRIHAGRLELRLEACNLTDIVRDVVGEQNENAPRRTLRLEMAGEHVPVQADAERVGQVLTNFLSNALKYSPEDHPVTVGLNVREGVVRVWVHDEGPGLAEAEQEHVWERFYRVPGVAHQHGSSVGLGMGLHISRTIVEGHGGHVGVESAPGAGATFWFELPLVALIR